MVDDRPWLVARTDGCGDRVTSTVTWPSKSAGVVVQFAIRFRNGDDGFWGGTASSQR